MSSKQSVRIRNVLRPAIATQVLLVFLSLEADAEMVPKFRVATACPSCSPPGFQFIRIKLRCCQSHQIVSSDGAVDVKSEN
jgi:hypothetical protein